LTKTTPKHQRLKTESGYVKSADWFWKSIDWKSWNWTSFFQIQF